jgi:hypothetical protein
MITLRGKWRITVASRSADWDQRVVINGSANADGPHPGVAGTVFDVEGESYWTLSIEHNDGSGWAESLLQPGPIAVNGTNIHFTVDSEDIVDQPNGDYNDLIIEVNKIGPIIEIPIRPFAVRPENFQMMPDGIFETYLGQYYMGVRVRNIWGKDFSADQMLDITEQSRTILAGQGIQIIDSWEASELESLGQRMNGRRIVIGALKQFESTTVYFKVNCANARANKYSVEFICLRPTMPDPNSPNRKASKKIFVSHSYLDELTKEMVAECPEGKVRMKIRKVLIDRASARRALTKIIQTHPNPPIDRVDLNRLLQAIETGKRIDICRLMKVMRCYCECKDVCGRGGNGRGKNPYDDFFIWPIEFSYTVETAPFDGTFSPLPYQDPWWKVLLLILAILLLIAAAISESEDLAYHDSDIVIGTLERWQSNDVDAAVCLLNGNRSLPSDSSFHYLDAQSGEVSTVPLDAMDTDISISGGTMTNTEIDALIAAGDLDDLRVFKSGARTGLTMGQISYLTPPWTRGEDGVEFNLPQLHIIQDPDQPMPLSNHGDSGSVWIHRNSRRIVGLNHSGTGGDSATASRIEDVMDALNIRFG